MGGVAGAFFGDRQAQADRAAARRAQADALAQYANISPPSIDDQNLDLSLFENIGALSPTLESNISMGPSAMENIALDPRLAQAQMGALEQLSQMGEVGLLPGERAALNQARRAAASEAQAKSAQLMDEYARRGMGGSGAELAARLQAGQSAADRQSQESDRLMQMAQERALSSISGAGNLAGQIGNQQFGQQSDVAKAKDYINQFNTQNQQNVQQRNVQNQNQAQLRNLETSQDIANKNVSTKNYQQEKNKGLLQQNFQNQMNLAAGRAGQYQGMANNAQQNAANTANMWSNIGKGVDTAAGAYFANSKPSSSNLSKEEEDAWLNS